MYKRYVTLVSLACKRGVDFVRNVFKKKSCGASPLTAKKLYFGPLQTWSEKDGLKTDFSNYDRLYRQEVPQWLTDAPEIFDRPDLLELLYSSHQKH